MRSPDISVRALRASLTLRSGAGVLILTLAFARELARHPWQLLLSVGGIALGVGVVLAIELASQGAHRSFQLANDAVMGPATHVVVGSDLGVARELLTRLRRHPAIAVAAPVLEAVGELAGKPVRLLGIDPLAEARFGRLPGVGEVPGNAAAPDGTALFGAPDGALLTSERAAALGLVPGQSFELRVGARDFELTLAGLLVGLQPGHPLADVVVMDVVLAGRLLGRRQHFSRIDLFVPELSALDGVAATLPADTKVRPVSVQRNTQREMTRAFELNLRMMSLLSLVVGMLLIYNTAYFSVSRRRETLATLRALGVSRNEVLCALLLEAWVLGLIGGFLGTLLGEQLGQGVLMLVTRTMQDLYFAAEVRGVVVGPGWAALGLALGAGATVLGSAYPLLRASETLPRLTYARTGLPAPSVQAVRWCAWVGLALVALAVVLVTYRTGTAPPGLIAGYAGLAAGLAGCSLLVPWVASALLGVLHRLQVHTRSPVLVTALGGLERHLGQVIVTVVALMIALAAAVGVGVMVDSFRASVRGWLDAALPADFYVTTPGKAAPRIPASALAALQALPEVEAASAGLWTTLEATEGPVRVFALQPARLSEVAFPLIDSIPGAWSQFLAGRGILISEPFAFKRALVPGSRLAVDAVGQTRLFTVLGVFRDYRTEHGFLLIHRSLFDRVWPRDAERRGFTGVGLYLAQPADNAARGRARERIAAVLTRLGLSVPLQSNDALRAYSLRVFERTFSVTDILRWITAAVAFFAVLGSTLALEISRVRERALLRALGFSRAQSGAVISLECLMQGLLAGVLSVPVGIALSWLLIEVINRRSFGWGMEIHFDTGTLALAVLSAAAASLLAGILPAYRAALAEPGAALRLD